MLLTHHGYVLLDPLKKPSEFTVKVFSILG